MRRWGNEVRIRVLIMVSQWEVIWNVGVQQLVGVRKMTSSEIRNN